MAAGITIPKAAADMQAINRMARQARKLCNDIIRQTSLKPMYGKYGGAAVFAAGDGSAEQAKRIKAVTLHLEFATQGLYDIAVEGGLSEAKTHAVAVGANWYGEDITNCK